MNTVSSLLYTVGRIPENSWATPFAPGPPMATVLPFCVVGSAGSPHREVLLQVGSFEFATTSNQTR